VGLRKTDSPEQREPERLVCPPFSHFVELAEQAWEQNRASEIRAEARRMEAVEADRLWRINADRALSAERRKYFKEEGAKAAKAQRQLFGAELAASIDAAGHPGRNWFPVDVEVSPGAKRTILASSRDLAASVRGQLALAGIAPGRIERSSISALEIGRFVSKGTLLHVDPTAEQLAELVRMAAEEQKRRVTERAAAHEAERRESQREDERRRFGTAVS
jgi:hypothetical protein